MPPVNVDQPPVRKFPDNPAQVAWFNKSLFILRRNCCFKENFLQLGISTNVKGSCILLIAILHIENKVMNVVDNRSIKYMYFSWHKTAV